MFYMSEDMQRDLHAVGSCKLKGFRFSYLFSAEVTKPRFMQYILPPIVV